MPSSSVDIQLYLMPHSLAEGNTLDASHSANSNIKPLLQLEEAALILWIGAPTEEKAYPR
jgi:hypothetical protein